MPRSMRVPTEDRVTRRGAFDAVGTGSGEERVAGIEAAGDGVGGGAPEVVGARDPHQQLDARPGAFQLPCETSVALRGGAAPGEQRRRQVVLDERRDPVGERARSPHPLEQRTGRGHASDVVTVGPDSAVDPLGGRRLAEVVAEGAEHQGQVLVTAAERARPVLGPRDCAVRTILAVMERMKRILRRADCAVCFVYAGVLRVGRPGESQSRNRGRGRRAPCRRRAAPPPRRGP